MDNHDTNIDRETLLLEYREAMESQRNLTSMAYSWTGSIFLVLSTGLFFYGTQLDSLDKLIPTMILAIALALVWFGFTESFVFYIRQRMQRIHEIEEILNMKLMSEAGREIKAMGLKSRKYELRSYLRAFVVVYILVWILLVYLNVFY